MYLNEVMDRSVNYVGRRVEDIRGNYVGIITCQSPDLDTFHVLTTENRHESFTWAEIYLVDPQS